jgi:hypothetical protein
MQPTVTSTICIDVWIERFITMANIQSILPLTLGREEYQRTRTEIIIDR